MNSWLLEVAASSYQHFTLRSIERYGKCIKNLVTMSKNRVKYVSENKFTFEIIFCCVLTFKHTLIKNTPCI